MLNPLRAIKDLFSRKHEWFTGNYSNFDEARQRCTGYDAPSILEKVKDALLKVQRGEAAYERDSVLFDKIEYSLPLLSALLYVASSSGNKLNILDFGGSLGSTYFQNRKFLDKLLSVSWNIVEQPHFVDCGRELFETAELQFFRTIEECMVVKNPNAILLSGVLPYLPEPYMILEKITRQTFDYIIVDRTPFFEADLPDRLTIEHVPEHIYRAEYPAWFFNWNKFNAFMTTNYELFERFDSWESWVTSGDRAQNLCLIYKRK
jgi:putative methyltransferase (TIGR04325 family)